VSPVKDPVGELPKSAPAVPDAVVGPVFVMPDPAKTAKELASPKSTLGWAAKLLVEDPAEATKRASAASDETAIADLVNFVVVVKELSIYGPHIESHPNLDS